MIDEISRLLADKCDAVAMMLLPNGKRASSQWVCGDVSGAPGDSLKIDLSGQHAGKWRDWSGEAHGDLLDLWAAVRGCALPEACSQARDWLGMAPLVRKQTEKAWSKPIPREQIAEGKIRNYLRNKRKLEDRIINRFRVGVFVKNRDGVDHGFIVYPSYSPSGVLVNNSYCGLERDEKGKKRVFQDTGCAPSLFGWQALDQRAFSARTVIICEGQIDCMTWTQWGFDCLSIPNGSGNTWIDFEWENLEVFTSIYISYDSDGKLSAQQEEVIARLGKHRCRLIRLPHKDANDGLQAGMTAEEAEVCVREAKAPKMEYFVALSDLRKRIFERFFPTETNRVLIQPPMLRGQYAEKTFTVRPGELSIWTGIASHGKSTMLAQFFMELVMLGQHVMINSFEMKPERIIEKMAKSFGGTQSIDREDLGGFLDNLGDRICFADKIGSLGESQLFELMEFAYARYGVSQFLIDSLMKIDGLEEDNKAIGKFINRLCTFASSRMVHVHLVAHPRKTAEDGRPGSNDLKGSSLIRNGADNIFIVHRNMENERKFAEGEITLEEFQADWDASVLVEKDREEGELKAFRYKFDKSSQRFTPMRILPPAPKMERKRHK